MARRSIISFIQTESGAALILFMAALIALALDNSSLSSLYQQFLNTKIGLHLGHVSFKQSLIFWINDGLMTLFFLLISLEVKRELFEGELNSKAKALLPGIAALGGMIIPAVIYLLINWHHRELWRGWAIPTATDVAFSLGILALLGRSIPISLKIFLTALAIFDDVGAIVIIAVFYTSHIALPFLVTSALLSLGLLLLNRLKIMQKWPYLLLGALLWVCMLNSGIHATLAGIVVGFAVPLKPALKKAIKNSDNQALAQASASRSLEASIHPWVAYGIVPLFAFANAGMNFFQFTPTMIFSSLPLGIFFSLWFGKSLGIMGASWLAIQSRWASLPNHCNFKHLFGISLLAGVGFTMSLLIGTLAFEPHQLSLVRLGVLSGSLMAGICGYVWLKCCRSEA
jgi:NhaA family Na+:H+ antiporter